MAAKTSRKYWEQRAAERMVDYMADAENTANALGKAYQAVGTYLSDEAEKVRKTFQSTFNLSEAEARRLIDSTPDKSMIDKLKASVSKIADPQKREEAEAIISSPAYAYRIQRMQALENNINEQCKRVYNAELKTDRRFFAAEADKAYKRTVFDMQKGMGISSAFDVMPESRINRILATKWSGEHFSDRVWNNTNALAEGLQNDMLVGIMAGKSEQHMAEDIMNRCGVGAFEARRLVRTETNYIANQAELDGYKECDIERYEFSACLDNRTSEICSELDGKVFPVSEAQPGVNLPPMHPFCRSTTLPVLPSEEDLDKVIAELGDEIGADVDFDEWVKGLQETEDGKLVYKAESVDKSAESGIIETGHRLVEEKKFSFDNYDSVINPKSVKKFEDTAKNLGYKYVNGIEKLTDGRTARKILNDVDELSKQYGKRFSRISIVDFGNEKTIAETFFGELRLNSKFMNKPDAIREVLNQWEKSNYIPKGCNTIQYVGKHEYFHLLSQNAIDKEKSQIMTEIRRQKLLPVSENAKKDAHEYVSDLLAATKLTPQQQKLKDKIFELIEKG